jgi:hypothetical protein
MLLTQSFLGYQFTLMGAFDGTSEIGRIGGGNFLGVFGEAVNK